jgi:hypothetical protein
MARPASISDFLAKMEKKSQKDLLRTRDGFTLEHSLREKLTSRFGHRQISVQVTALLLDLPAQVPDTAEREFLNEAIICYRHGAFRAAIVMTWNLTFDHLLNYVLKHHLAAFNTQWPRSYQKLHQKARVAAISTRDDFSELKESEILTICRSAAIISGDLYQILDEKLGRRNSAAHPSTVTITQLQAESVIDDLIRNVVLKLKV